MSEEEQAYVNGKRMTIIGMLGYCLRQLDVGDPEIAKVAWIAERILAINALRQVCAEHGDNDWPDDLHLADIIEKHLHRHLWTDILDEAER